MKACLPLCFLLFAPNAFAGATMKIDFKDYSGTRVTEFKQELDAELGRVTTFAFPDKQKEIEVMINQIESKAVVEIKLYDVSFGQRNLVASPRIITNWGEQALLQEFKDENNKQPLTTLKVRAEQF